MDEFTQAITDIEKKYEALLKSPKYIMSALPKEIPNAGIYIFSENGLTFYVGRTDRLPLRLKEQACNDQKKAAFAFLLAREKTGNTKATYKKEGSRKDLLKQPAFRSAFDDARQRIRRMEVQFIEEPDPIRQAILEICVFVRKKARYSSFDNH